MRRTSYLTFIFLGLLFIAGVVLSGPLRLHVETTQRLLTHPSVASFRPHILANNDRPSAPQTRPRLAPQPRRRHAAPDFRAPLPNGGSLTFNVALGLAVAATATLLFRKLFNPGSAKAHQASVAGLRCSQFSPRPLSRMSFACCASASPIVDQEVWRQQISDQETELMRPARQPLPAPVSAVADPTTAAHLLKTQGCVHLANVLSPAECRELLAEVAPRLELATARSALGGAQCRFDLKLPLEGMTYAAVQTAMGRGGLANVLERVAGPEAWLAELGALVSEPGAVRQPVHPDTVSRGGNEQPIYSTFIALQDVTPAMGPTCMVPGTNNPQAHADLCGIGHASHRALLATRPNFDATLRCGDAVVFDSRTLHAGGFNHPTEGGRRVLFYVSVQRAVDGEQVLPAAPERRTPPCAYSILRDYHNRFQLKDWRLWSAW